jgi:acetylglutamate kinase
LKKKLETVNTLLDALPYIQKFNGKKVVIKYGGSAWKDDNLKKKFAKDVILLTLIGIKPIIVHGGGDSITELLTKLDIKTQFVDGQRVTSKEAMKVVEMVLAGDINKEITSLLNIQGAKAIGVCGKDASFIKAIPKDGGKFGYTGIIESIDPTTIENLINEKFIPVIAPIGSANELDHPGFNINADVCACEVAVAVQAEKVIFLTDTVGVLDNDKNLIQTLREADINRLKDEKVIIGGMIPKVESCLKAINNGVKKAHIIDGRIEHSILLELLTNEGIGTAILPTQN